MAPAGCASAGRSIDVVDTYAPAQVRRVLAPILTLDSLAFLTLAVVYGVKVTAYHVNVPRFIEKAHARNADAITLDLEDSLPPAEKAPERKLIREAARQVARGGAEVGVRVNLIVESPRGLLRAEEIGAASPRTASTSVGPEDYCLMLGVEPSADGAELACPVARVVTICKALGLTPNELLALAKHGHGVCPHDGRCWAVSEAYRRSPCNTPAFSGRAALVDRPRRRYFR